MNRLDYRDLAKPIIALGIDAIEKAKSGHPGAIMGMSDFMTVLFAKFLKFSAKNPHWAERDRFVLSNGHASMLLYSILYLTGYESPTLEEIKNFRQLGAVTAGHPEYGHLPGVESTTGPLGQGFANAVGMAIAQKKANHIDSKIYVSVGDGCLMEGVSHEAASLAGHLGLDNLIVLFDSNSISIDGSTSLADSTDTKKRFEAYNWHVIEADGHNYDEIEDAFFKALESSDKPKLIIFNTVIANHADKKRGRESSHGAPLGEYELNFVKKAIGYDNYKSFEIPEDILLKWRNLGSRFDEKIKSNYKDDKNFQVSENLNFEIDKIKKLSFESDIVESTRKSSGRFLEGISSVFPELLGGSADLSESNCTKNKFSKPLSKNNFTGNFIHYGIREHAMTAVVNGIALYKAGFLPFGSGFLIFSDYAKPAIRLSALMSIQTVQVFTHDSIGLGEDGPTHQPIEQLAGLRSIPNLLVFRPADSFETVCSWEIALKTYDQPSVIVCSRQDLKQLPKNRLLSSINNDIKKGAYIVKDFNNLDIKKKIIIISSGSEVSLGLSVAEKVEKEYQDITVKVISVVCTNLLDKNEDYCRNIIDDNVELRVVIEAGCRFYWDKYLRTNDLFIGIHDKFGASGQAKDLYDFYGLNIDTIFNKILKKIEKSS